jgi:hypothetical protein
MPGPVQPEPRFEAPFGGKPDLDPTKPGVQQLDQEPGETFTPTPGESGGPEPVQAATTGETTTTPTGETFTPTEEPNTGAGALHHICRIHDPLCLLLQDL